jgi:CMP-N-acetylneuraminic acid synthetase
MEIWAIVPARGGSKGFPGKNLALLAGRPLIRHTIDAAFDAVGIDRVVVSSDDPAILACAAAAGAETLRRPAELAMDDTPTSPVIAHLLEQLAHPDQLANLTLVLLQPTSPLRTAADIEGALAEYRRPVTDSVISVYEPQHSPLKSFVADAHGYIHGIVDERMPFMPRQSLPKAYYPNGALYVFNAASFLLNQAIPLGRCRPFVMPGERSIDIDTPADLQVAESWLRKHHE